MVFSCVSSNDTAGYNTTETGRDLATNSAINDVYHTNCNYSARNKRNLTLVGALARAGNFLAFDSGKIKIYVYTDLVVFSECGSSFNSIPTYIVLVWTSSFLLCTFCSPGLILKFL